jgi:hypothetical protein
VTAQLRADMEGELEARSAWCCCCPPSRRSSRTRDTMEMVAAAGAGEGPGQEEEMQR